MLRRATLGWMGDWGDGVHRGLGLLRRVSRRLAVRGFQRRYLAGVGNPSFFPSFPPFPHDRPGCVPPRSGSTGVMVCDDAL